MTLSTHDQGFRRSSPTSTRGKSSLVETKSKHCTPGKSRNIAPQESPQAARTRTPARAAGPGSLPARTAGAPHAGAEVHRHRPRPGDASAPRSDARGRRADTPSVKGGGEPCSIGQNSTGSASHQLDHGAFRSAGFAQHLAMPEASIRLQEHCIPCHF